MGESSGSKKLGLWGIIALAFFSITGGPYNNEPVISALGLGYTWFFQFSILVFHAFPLILCCLEQTLLIPVNGGPLMWSRACLGPLGSHITAIFGFMSYMTQVAFLGNTSLNYVAQMFPSFFEYNFVEPLLVSILIVVCSVIDINKLGRLLEVILIFSLIPAFTFFFYGVYKTEHFQDLFTPFLVLPKPKINLFQGFMQLYWMNSGIANVMIRVEDAESPLVFRRAVLINTVLASLAYVIPMWGGVLVDGTHFSRWDFGYFLVIAEEHMPRYFFPFFTTVAGLVGSLGLLIAQVLITVEFTNVCAELGSLPRFLLASNGSHSSVRVGILVSGLGIILSLCVTTEKIVQCVGVSYALFIAMHFVSFYKLRYMYLDRERPFMVNVKNKFLVSLLATVPIVFICAPLYDIPYDVFILFSIVSSVGIFLYTWHSEFTGWFHGFRHIFANVPVPIHKKLLYRNCLVPVEEALKVKAVIALEADECIEDVQNLLRKQQQEEPPLSAPCHTKTAAAIAGGRQHEHNTLGTPGKLKGPNALEYPHRGRKSSIKSRESISSPNSSSDDSIEPLLCDHHHQKHKDVLSKLDKRVVHDSGRVSSSPTPRLLMSPSSERRPNMAMVAGAVCPDLCLSPAAVIGYPVTAASGLSAANISSSASDQGNRHRRASTATRVVLLHNDGCIEVEDSIIVQSGMILLPCSVVADHDHHKKQYNYPRNSHSPSFSPHQHHQDIGSLLLTDKMKEVETIEVQNMMLTDGIHHVPETREQAISSSINGDKTEDADTNNCDFKDCKIVGVSPTGFRCLVHLEHWIADGLLE